MDGFCISKAAQTDAPPWSTPTQTGGTQFLSLEQFSGKYNYTYQKNTNNVAD